jgi:hypothetical protein
VACGSRQDSPTRCAGRGRTRRHDARVTAGLADTMRGSRQDSPTRCAGHGRTRRHDARVAAGFAETVRGSRRGASRWCVIGSTALALSRPRSVLDAAQAVQGRARGPGVSCNEAAHAAKGDAGLNGGGGRWFMRRWRASVAERTWRRSAQPWGRFWQPRRAWGFVVIWRGLVESGGGASPACSAATKDVARPGGNRSSASPGRALSSMAFGRQHGGRCRDARICRVARGTGERAPRVTRRRG